MEFDIQTSFDLLREIIMNNGNFAEIIKNYKQTPNYKISIERLEEKFNTPEEPVFDVLMRMQAMSIDGDQMVKEVIDTCEKLRELESKVLILAYCMEE